MEFFLSLSSVFRIIIELLIAILLFRLCFFLRYFSKFESTSLISIFVLMFGMVVCFFNLFVERHCVMQLKENYALAEGEITYYETGRGKSKGQIEYNYMVDEKMILDTLYENSFVKIPDEKPDTTLKYLVIYHEDSPQNSFILCDYPIIGNLDKIRYEKLFEKEIPIDVFGF
jgi:hypothetical protein